MQQKQAVWVMEFEADVVMACVAGAATDLHRSRGCLGPAAPPRVASVESCVRRDEGRIGRACPDGR